jgi:hypothetical protein
MLESREDRNRFRKTIIKAEEDEIITKEEVGFIVTLTTRFRADIEKKVKLLHQLQGEIAQLKNNEQIIISVVENLVKAAERDQARRELSAKLRESREVEKERHEARKRELPKEQADKDETAEELKVKERESQLPLDKSRGLNSDVQRKS